MSSLKKNILYSSVLTISGYLFPLITFPYVTRVLGVSNIGICNFVDSVVHYFIVFSMMGIMTLGIREVAKSKGNRDALSMTFSSLFVLNMIFTVAAIVILFFVVFYVPKLSCYSKMFYIGAAKIIANAFLIEWLYKGLEDFRYITIRSVIVRSFYVVAVFLLVRNEDDFQLYFFLTTMMFVANAIVNIAYSRHFVDFSIKDILLLPHLKPYIVLGVYVVLTNLYTTFNVMYLGFTMGEIQVGYYTTAIKLYSTIMSFYTAFTGVMMPRMSSLLTEGKYDEFKTLSSKSIEILLAFAMPIIVITEICAPQIIQIMAGNGYEQSIMPMRIVMPLMLVIGYEQIIVLQMLVPMKKDTSILVNSMIGATVGVLFNILLVSHMGCNGTAIVWVLSEFAVLLSAQYFVVKYIDYHMPFIALLKRIVFVIPIAIIDYKITLIISQLIISFLIVSCMTFAYFAFVEICVLKNQIIISNLNRLYERIKL